MDRTDLAAMIDHTLLKPDATFMEIEMLCNEALEYGFASACVNPVWVPAARRILEGGKPLVCSVIGFPLGASSVMAEEAARAVDQGSGELDMVIPIGFLRSGMTDETARCVRDVVRASSGRPVKVIIETCLLTDREKRLACRIALEGGAEWVKTSTGFSSGGATARDVALMKETVGDRLGVKASGGIRTLDDAMEMIRAGARRLGCSRSVQIIDSLEG
ncbi:MAG: deoxyribose-phosphate aldolase [Candidatus Fermentibacteraceae bacterium]|nr:deoxyribose-phosphate aldolase [Candidatus Fermentibacteraceae bacterium]MBN2607767.1 deoxyribose-phosphate aldolase [Candidatus Fermentibacteraceae bacterium]